MNLFTIRPFAASDAPACTLIFDRAWHAGHPYAPRKIDAEMFAKETAEEVQFAAVDDAGRVLGFVSLYEPDSFVHHLFVDPELHGRGVGRALLAHAVAQAGGRATLKCQTRNERALGFYRGLGWTEVAAGVSDIGEWVAMRSPE